MKKPRIARMNTEQSQSFYVKKSASSAFIRGWFASFGSDLAGLGFIHGSCTSFFVSFAFFVVPAA